MNLLALPVIWVSGHEKKKKKQNEEFQIFISVKALMKSAEFMTAVRDAIKPG